VILVAGAALLSGCWSQIGADGGHTRNNAVETTLTPATVSGLHEVWSATVPGSVSEPLIWRGRAYVTATTANGTGVRAVSLVDGSTAWETSLLGGVGGEGSLVAGTAVTLVGDQLRSGHLGFAPITRVGPVCVTGTDVLDPATGAESGGPPVFPSPTASDGATVAYTALDISPSPDCALRGVDLHVTSGATSWSASYPDFPSGAFLPTLAGGQVFLSHTSSLDAYAAAGCGAATCSPTWTRDLGAAPATPVAGRTGPVFVSVGGDLLALDRTTGAEMWRAPGAGGSIALAHGTVYAATASGATPTLKAFVAAGCGSASCAPTWTATLPGTAATSVAVGGDVVYTSTTNGVQAFATSGCGAPTCSALVDVAQPASATITVGQGRVLLASSGRLAALAL
jgi:outer membrane protein assembly factor BamB